jgi:hypothetical protein
MKMTVPATAKSKEGDCDFRYESIFECDLGASAQDDPMIASAANVLAARQHE